MYAWGPKMNPTFTRLWKSVLLAALLAPAGIAAAAPAPAPAQSGDSEAAKARLAAVRAKIAALSARLGAELADRDAESARLRQAELAITAKRRALDALHADGAEVERRRALLRQERQRTENALAAARSELAGQVRGAYMIGRHEELKLLLNQSDPGRVGRMTAYYGYRGRARAAEIAAIGEQVLRLQSLGGQIDAESAKLRALAEQTRGELAGLVRARAERAVLVASISRQLGRGDLELAALKREEQSLESLLADLESVMQDFPTDSAMSFGQMRGRLPWPVTGRLAAHYQELRADAPQGGLRWNGILIEAARGEKVRAPYFGRVIYADWLQGLGLLMIISHSGGYLSLYGHAEVLYKGVGDWVAPGDVIASLGEAEGEKPRLYFEIRQGRKPLDPKLWLK